MRHTDKTYAYCTKCWITNRTAVTSYPLVVFWWAPGGSQIMYGNKPGIVVVGEARVTQCENGPQNPNSPTCRPPS